MVELKASFFIFFFFFVVVVVFFFFFIAFEFSGELKDKDAEREREIIGVGGYRIDENFAEKVARFRTKQVRGQGAKRYSSFGAIGGARSGCAGTVSSSFLCFFVAEKVRRKKKRK
jgi:hypothetical protein